VSLKAQLRVITHSKPNFGKKTICEYVKEQVRCAHVGRAFLGNKGRALELAKEREVVGEASAEDGVLYPQPLGLRPISRERRSLG
jgi:hypothetical protein